MRSISLSPLARGGLEPTVAGSYLDGPPVEVLGSALAQEYFIAPSICSCLPALFNMCISLLKFRKVQKSTHKKINIIHNSITQGEPLLNFGV